MIARTIQALAAVRLLALPDEERPLLSPLLDKERQELLAMLVKNAFAEAAMGLGPLVTDVSFDDETDGDDMFSITLVVPVGFTATRHGVVRRALEQLIAFTALSHFDPTFAFQATHWHSALTAAVTPSFTPHLRPGTT